MLPAVALTDAIAAALKDHNVVLSAQPGAGKSTGLPLALLCSGIIDGKIIMLEPRRLAARAVAERLALHMGERVGESIGLRMRSDTRVSSSTRLEVVTEGVLTKILQNDPELEGVALIIFDEFHERSLHADLGLALCLEVQKALRTDLRLLLMSATLETDLLEQALGNAISFNCEVRQHAVDTVFLGDSTEPLPQRMVRAVLSAINKHEGDVLVFLPGVAEINRTARLLASRIGTSRYVIVELHGGIDASAQRQATVPVEGDSQRIILSTSLAETSITIIGVTVVIDSGLERRGRIDPATGAQMLETVMASQASATQRAGRAGRTAPGVCYRLWSEQGHVRRPVNWQPEILRADLAPLFVELAVWGEADAQALPWLEKPPASAISRAQALLARLGIWQAGRLGQRGRSVAALPVHPRLGNMLVWAAENANAPLACKVAVCLEEHNVAFRTVDLESIVSVSLPGRLQRQVDRLNSRVTDIAGPPGQSTNKPSLGVVLAQAFPDWIARRRQGDPGNFLLSCGAGAMLDSDDPLAHEQWLVVAQMGGAGKRARIFKGAKLDIDELQKYSPELFSTIDHLDWDNNQQRMLGEHRLMLGTLVVEARSMQKISDADRSRGLLAGIRAEGLGCLPWTDECRQWQARVQRMAKLTIPVQSDVWPDVSDDALESTLDQWLMPFLSGVGSIKAVQQLDLLKILKTLLDYRQQALLDDWLPQRFTVPSGSSIRLSYTATGNPVLSVRLQEMLGCTLNPSVAKGQVMLKVELLSPARRPVQITEDLVNFWTSSYPAVKKEMAGRYPKHVWPDDPLKAQPTTKAKPRKGR